MELILKREIAPSSPRTFGKLYVGNVFCAHSLEDQVREVEGEPVESWKIKGETAIPRGRYKVTITPSNRFKRDLPLLHDVPGFTAIRIHPGNTEIDTEGCLLVGADRTATALLNSRLAFVELMADIQDALNHDEEVWITVT